MSFVDHFNILPERATPTVRRFQTMLGEVDDAGLERMAQASETLTRQHFGRTMRLFAPLYVSNECVNNCSYCGFSRDNPILRVTLDEGQVVDEARHLAERGFRSILLVAGEHPRFVSEGYLERCIESIRHFVPSVALEVGPMETPEYARMVAAGCEGLVVYQETYDREAYADLHTAGPKKKFDWRLECPERAYAGGFRRIGVGALFGLADWRTEALGLAAHLDYLQRHCWKAHYTVSFPRIRPAAGEFQPRTQLADREFVQMLCAFRTCFPEIGIVLSTRETASFRDAIARLGITSMSAESHTEPGGYTGAGADDLHLTVRGRRVELDAESAASACSTPGTAATSQFGIADQRTAAEVAQMLATQGLEPVWKDWDEAILTDASPRPAESEPAPALATER